MNASTLLRPHPKLAWPLLRIATGLLFVPHALFKLNNMAASVALFGKIGFAAPEFFVWLTVVAELAAAIGMVLNLCTRWSALIGAGIMFVASLSVLNLKGPVWLWNLGGIEYNVFWAIACLAVALIRPGKPGAVETRPA